MRLNLIFLLIIKSTFSYSQINIGYSKNNYILLPKIGAGIFIYRELTGSSSDVFYTEYEDPMLEGSLSFMYMNKYITTAIRAEQILILDETTRSLISSRLGFNMIWEKFENKLFFGPVIQYGFYLHRPGFSVGKTNLTIGLELYKGNFHVGVNRGWNYHNDDFEVHYHEKMNTVFLEIGYMLNLKKRAQIKSD